mmetsp:Transcript_3106/g.4700  ORF Transcript_3106/g.4700 Transcript_3106/m.4700 type:complete len:572 (+) Transcript_3106:113-1828(+)
MAKLRGDDDILSLMNELSAEQGYRDGDKNISKKEDADSTSPLVRHHLEDDSHDITIGNTSIWNSSVKVKSASDLEINFVPTSPTIEIFRRRAYERFKGDFLKKFEQACGNSTKIGISNLWKELSIVSLMERWHFSVKLSESQGLGPDQAEIPRHESFDTRHVYRYIEESSQENRWIDPVLINSQAGGQSLLSRRNASFRKLLLDEIMFEWTRAWCRKMQGKREKSELDVVFSSKQFQRKVSGLSHAIMDASIEAFATFKKDIGRRAAMEATQSSKKRNNLPKLCFQYEDVVITHSGLSLSINSDHFEKLKTLFDRNNKTSATSADHKAKFVSSLFCLLARYDMLQGSGLQSAVNGTVFDVLLKHYECNTECFASPLNCRYERYLSAFPDTDCSFGSLGSFFSQFDFRCGGCYQANPPFIANFIDAMSSQMEKHLSECMEPLMFIVFVPCWSETSGWKALKSSRYLKNYILIDQKSHFYTEGTQHRRKERFRVASFDTSIFFLQNKAGERKWKILRSHIEDIMKAFNRLEENNNPGEAKALERQKKKKRKVKNVEGSSEHRRKKKKAASPIL